MGNTRYGVTFSYYGGASWKLAQLERDLRRQHVPILAIRGCAYPEMARAEQVRQARIGQVETVVFVDSHVDITVREIEEMVSVAERHGVSVSNEPDSPWVLECCAVRRDVIEAMIRVEERRYENTAAVDTSWGGAKVPAVPVANPWNRDHTPLVAGSYLTDGQAFIVRAIATGAVVAQHFPDGLKSNRRRMLTRVANAEKPLTGEPGSQFALCMPTFGVLDLDQQKAVWELERAGMTIFGLHDCPWIDQARSWLTERALSVGKGVFFLDHDIIFQPNDILKLCEQALEKQGVVSASYCMRKSGKNIIGAFDVPPGPMKFFEGGETLPAFYTGLGFTAVPKDTLEGIAVEPLRSDALGRGLGWGEKIRPWFALDCSTGFYAGEDVSFCNRVHDLAVKMAEIEPGNEEDWTLSHSGRPARVFIDSRIRIFHRGSYDYGVEDAGIVVPRIESLASFMTGSRQEARDMLVNALDLPLEVKLEMQEFSEAE